MYIAFNAPHDPRQAPKEYVDKYPLDRIELPKNFLPEYPVQGQQSAARRNCAMRSLAPLPRTEHAVKVHRQEYYALITHMDAQIGRILDALEKSGQAANTWIFFTADHGSGRRTSRSVRQAEHVRPQRAGSVHRRGSGRGCRTSRRDAAIYLQDVMPTVLELAETKPPGHVFLPQPAAAVARRTATVGLRVDLRRVSRTAAIDRHTTAGS